MNEILKFIEKFKFKYKEELVEVFTTGNCYYFAIILKERFNGEIYYMPIINHFICKIENKYYDITGEVNPSEHPYKWSEYKLEDKKHTNSITKYCITFEAGRTI